MGDGNNADLMSPYTHTCHISAEYYMHNNYSFLFHLNYSCPIFCLITGKVWNLVCWLDGSPDTVHSSTQHLKDFIFQMFHNTQLLDLISRLYIKQVVVVGVISMTSQNRTVFFILRNDTQSKSSSEKRARSKEVCITELSLWEELVKQSSVSQITFRQV